MKRELNKLLLELSSSNNLTRKLEVENKSLNDKNLKINESYERLKSDLDPYHDVSTKIENAKRTGLSKLAKLQEEISKLNIGIGSQRSELEAINKELADRKSLMLNGEFEFSLNLQGYKTPEFELEDTPAYVIAIKQLKIEQKDMLRRKTAVFCLREWQIVEDKRENSRIISNAIKLTARAFNNECDLLISKVSWKNAEATKDKISKLAKLLNKLNQYFRIHISDEYVFLRLREVELTRQERIKREEDRERLKEQQAIERDEREAQREYQAEIRRQEKIEKEKAKRLQDLKDRFSIASAEHRAALEAEISRVEEELSEAMRQKGRAMAMAEHTRIGHVYIISNEGSFGQNILKIGLTRRLEPMQRVKELSSASVPFPFEVHAMVFSEDAPALERQLHNVFSAYRVNTANIRKEFFKISPGLAKEELDKILPNVPFETTTYSSEHLNSIS